MCLHNAKRDAFILRPVTLSDERGARFWNPLSGETSKWPMRIAVIDVGLKNAKRRRKSMLTATARQ